MLASHGSFAASNPKATGTQVLAKPVDRFSMAEHHELAGPGAIEPIPPNRSDIAFDLGKLSRAEGGEPVGPALSAMRHREPMRIPARIAWARSIGPHEAWREGIGLNPADQAAELSQPQLAVNAQEGLVAHRSVGTLVSPPGMGDQRQKGFKQTLTLGRAEIFPFGDSGVKGFGEFGEALDFASQHLQDLPQEIVPLEALAQLVGL